MADITTLSPSLRVSCANCTHCGTTPLHTLCACVCWGTVSAATHQYFTHPLQPILSTPQWHDMPDLSHARHARSRPQVRSFLGCLAAVMRLWLPQRGLAARVLQACHTLLFDALHLIMPIPTSRTSHSVAKQVKHFKALQLDCFSRGAHPPQHPHSWWLQGPTHHHLG